VWFSSKHGKDSSKGHIAVVDLDGIIMTSSSKIKELEEAQKAPGVKAIVLRINSPGGLVAPSQELYDAVRRVDKKVPVIASMGSLAASGGYYTAVGARKIYANSGTLTASIGVIMEFANTSKLYQWAKVERFALKGGKFKDVGSPLRPMTEDERALLMGLITDIHQQFRATVKERRKLTDQELDNTADGRIMTGNQAKKAKLVDELGGYEDAISDAKKIAGLPEDAPVVFPESKDGLLKKILFGDNEESKTDLSAIFSSLKALPDLNIGAKWRLWLLAPAY
jgi:protease-4